MDNRTLLESIGETCTCDEQCKDCEAELSCRKEIYEQNPDLKNH